MENMSMVVKMLLNIVNKEKGAVNSFLRVILIIMIELIIYANNSYDTFPLLIS